MTQVVSPDVARRLAEGRGRVRVWVFFTDKGIRDSAERDAAVRQQASELPARTLQRRMLRRERQGLADFDDVPVADQYIRQIQAAGARLRRVSRWLNAVSVEADAAQVRAIVEMPFVRHVRLVGRSVRGPTPVGELNGQPLGGGPEGDPPWYGASYDQLNQIGVTAAHDAGFTGTGIVIGILDTGFNRTHACFNQSTNGAHPVQVLGEHDYVDDDPITSYEPGDPPDQHHHGTLILGTLGSFHPTVLVGSAYNASFYLAKTEDITQEVPAEEDDYVAGLEWFELVGVDVATSSLGYIDWYTQANLDGLTAVTTVAVNIATANGMVCCTAAGNYGHDGDPLTSSLLAPADAFAVLTCGAVHGDGVIAGFSSSGPTADGRSKPEVLARGVGTMTVSPANDTDLVGASGTSLSTPLVAGASALLVQAHPNWSVTKIRRALMHTASDFLANATPDPLFVRGHGVINVMAAIQFVHGDVDGDGIADGRDIGLFVAALLGTNGEAAQRRRADVNASGAVNLTDVPMFVADLLGA